MTGDMAEYYADEGVPAFEEWLAAAQADDEAYEADLSQREAAGWDPEDDR